MNNDVKYVLLIKRQEFQMIQILSPKKSHCKNCQRVFHLTHKRLIGEWKMDAVKLKELHFFVLCSRTVSWKIQWDCGQKGQRFFFGFLC